MRIACCSIRSLSVLTVNADASHVQIKSADMSLDHKDPRGKDCTRLDRRKYIVYDPVVWSVLTSEQNNKTHNNHVEISLRRTNKVVEIRRRLARRWTTKVGDAVS